MKLKKGAKVRIDPNYIPMMRCYTLKSTANRALVGEVTDVRGSKITVDFSQNDIAPCAAGYRVGSKAWLRQNIAELWGLKPKQYYTFMLEVVEDGQ